MIDSGLDQIQPGDTAGPYRIVRTFHARGGMARVFGVEVREKYRQPGMPRYLALKVARPEHQDALVAEADYLCRFDHPNVVRIVPLPGYHRPVYAARERFGFGWGWYYAMELVDGGSLENRLTRSSTMAGPRTAAHERRRRFSLLETLGVARQALDALQHIHERHVVNLDVKPGNILFRRRPLNCLRGSVGRVVLCDFGIARDLRYPRAGILGVATPEYISPEQALETSAGRRPVDARSDIFSLGVVLYEMLTGRLPFESIAITADSLSAAPPLRPLRRSVPALLEEIVLKALDKEPQRRFGSAAEMRAALQQVKTPLDWAAAGRRAFAGAALAGCLAGGGLLVTRLPLLITETTPTATAQPTPTVATATPSPPPSSTPTVPVSTAPPTSTPLPTFTPTHTPRPATATPTPGG